MNGEEGKTSNAERPTPNVEGAEAESTPDVQSEALRVAAFLRRHWGGCRSWDRPNLLGWVGWFLHRGYFAIVSDGGRIVGVAFGRPVASLAQACTDPYYAEEAAAGCFCDVLVGTAPHVMEIVWQAMLVRLGRVPEWVAFERESHRPRCYPFGRIDRWMSQRGNFQHGRN